MRYRRGGCSARPAALTCPWPEPALSLTRTVRGELAPPVRTACWTAADRALATRGSRGGSTSNSPSRCTRTLFLSSPETRPNTPSSRSKLASICPLARSRSAALICASASSGELCAARATPGLVVGVHPADQVDLRQPGLGNRMAWRVGQHAAPVPRRRRRGRRSPSPSARSRTGGRPGHHQARRARQVRRAHRGRRRSRPCLTLPARLARTDHGALAAPGRPPGQAWPRPAWLGVGLAGRGCAGVSGPVRGLGLPAYPGRHAELIRDLQDLGDPLPHLRLRQRAEEAVHELAADHGHHHRDRLHLQRGGQLGVRVHVNLGQQPVSGCLVGQLLQHRAELLARLAPLRPQVHDHRRGLGPADDLGVEGRVGDLEDVGGASAAGRAARSVRGAWRPLAWPRGRPPRS